MSTFDDRRLQIQAPIALLLANARYWPTVAPIVRTQMGRYLRHAQAIRDPVLKALALDKLDDQRFHAQTAATLATLAPRPHRRSAAQAVVAIEVIYDYLDGLTERPSRNPLRDGSRLFQAITDAIRLDREPTGGYYGPHPKPDDGGYLRALVAEACDAFARLPAADAIAPAAARCAERFSEAQIRAHAIPRLGVGQLREWAAREAAGTGLGWLEYFAGATSTVLGLHALIAAAADPRTTPQQAEQIDAFYLYTGVVVTMLDSVIDYPRDVASTGEPGYARYYENREQLEQGLTSAIHLATAQARGLRNAPHHVMTLAGVVAFYTSAPTATTDFAIPVVRHVRRELRPLVTPTLAVMRTWRLAKRWPPGARSPSPCSG